MQPATHKTIEPASEYDLVVLGAGAAGLTAALVGAIEGLRVLLIESSTRVGGTSARSAGALWIPGNHFMTNNVADLDIERARIYLNNVVGKNSPASMREAFLTNGPSMLRYLRDQTGVRFNRCQQHADYHRVDGASSAGRPVEAAVFDGRQLGADFQYLRSPIKEVLAPGGMMVNKADRDLYLSIWKKGNFFYKYPLHYPSLWHWMKLKYRVLFDRLMRYPRGTRLTVGNALCASLFHECLKREVAVLINSTVESIQPAGAVPKQAHQLEITDAAGKQLSVVARWAVIFAGGGFSGNPVARKENFPHPTPKGTAAFEGANGSSQSLALSLGAQLGPSGEHNAWWAPASIVPRTDGTDGVFPHLFADMAKPGLMAVDRQGRRFTNEGASYDEFARAQYANDAIPCWLICDDYFIQRYGLGAVPPDGFSFCKRMVKAGYLSEADSLAELAEKIGVDPDGLTQSAKQMTEFATKGVDPEFGKGSDVLSRQMGEPDTRRAKNPCLGPIDSRPFYAMRVEPADLGTSLGLLTNEKAQLLDNSGNPIAGLYACGNDMQSVMGGQYPGPGASLGPGMTFAYLAAMDCVETSK